AVVNYMAMVNMNNLLNGKDSRWLQLEVCREFQRNKCTRPDTECKFAHPPANVEVQNGRVTACYDSIKELNTLQFAEKVNLITTIRFPFNCDSTKFHSGISDRLNKSERWRLSVLCLRVPSRECNTTSFLDNICKKIEDISEREKDFEENVSDDTGQHD
ncbi:hypothetical protein L9F63_010742, partial [Diploptera punctata]